ncbi:ILK kinase, partial [Columbina picui]|nr:ILK kinase [Columbina picui]
MLIMRGARINVMNRGDDTPLHLAASHGHRDIVQKLIQFKADINAVNEHGNAPLHYACFWGHDQVAEDLVGNGALVSIANKYGETPIDKAKTPLREVLRGRGSRPDPQLSSHCSPCARRAPCAHPAECWGGDRAGAGVVSRSSTRCFPVCLGCQGTPPAATPGWARAELRLPPAHLPHPACGVCQRSPRAQGTCPHPLALVSPSPPLTLVSPSPSCPPADFVVDQMQAVKFAFDIARGMAFLHTLEPLIPRHHLNSRSVMIDEDMTARISMADVKFSFQCPGRMYAPAWVAPEALQKKPEEINRRSADMWSFAVLLWELVTREVPFADLSNMEIGMKVALEGLRPTIPPGISPHICKLMKICMNEDPAKRPKFDMIVPILEKMQEK